MTGPVAPTLDSLSSTGVACAPPAHMVVAEVRQSGTGKYEKSQKMGLVMFPLTTSYGDPPLIAGRGPCAVLSRARDKTRPR